MGWPPISWSHVFHTSSQEVLETEPIIDEIKEVFLHNKINSNVMRVGYIILAAVAESEIDKNNCLLESQSTRNAFANDKYLSNTINYPDRQYSHVHCNSGVTYTTKIGDLPV